MLETPQDLVILKTLALINKDSQQFLVHHLLLLHHPLKKNLLPHTVSLHMLPNMTPNAMAMVELSADAEKPSADALRDAAALAAEDAAKF